MKGVKNVSMLSWLDRNTAVHQIFNRLGLRSRVNAVLAAFPVVRRLPGSGVKFRHVNVESFALADELFSQHVYDGGLAQRVTTFADLGCNSGYFTALVAHRMGTRDLAGIAIDANRHMVHETEWVIHANKISGVTALCGVVGGPEAHGEAEFFINPCGLLSSQHPIDVPGLDRGGTWTRTLVRYIDVEQIWLALVGQAECDLLKLDIEGGEAAFITPDNPFLRRVRSILVEWHAWIISFDEVARRLSESGFDLVAVLEQHGNRGTAHFTRVRSPDRA